MFKNKASRPYSIYFHGVTLSKNAEGANYPLDPASKEFVNYILRTINCCGGFHCFEDAVAKHVCEWEIAILCSASADLLCCLIEKTRYCLQTIDKYPFLVS